MAIENPHVIEFFAIESTSRLKTICRVLSEILSLPPFRFDMENECKWGETSKDGIVYNVSCPVEKGTFQQWDAMFPKDCNISFGLEFSSSTANEELDPTPYVNQIGAAIAKALETPVIHYRTWRPTGNVSRDQIFHP